MAQDEKKPTVFERVHSVYGIPVPQECCTDKMGKLFKRILKRHETLSDLNKFLRRRSKEERETNPLTGLPNQVALTRKLSTAINERNEMRTLQSRLAEEKDSEERACIAKEIEERSQSIKDPYTVVFSDLNYFGIYNDKLGDLATDGLIQKIALLLGNEIRRHNGREDDYLARSKTEGDEFVILMPDASGDKATERMDAIGKSIAGKKFLVETPDKNHFLVTNITIAFGCYQLDTKVKETGLEDKDYFEVLHSARKLMKKKKEAMKAATDVTPRIEEITDNAELRKLQYDEEIIKVFPVDMGKMQSGHMLQ